MSDFYPQKNPKKFIKYRKQATFPTLTRWNFLFLSDHGERGDVIICLRLLGTVLRHSEKGEGKITSLVENTIEANYFNCLSKFETFLSIFISIKFHNVNVDNYKVNDLLFTEH